MFLTLEQIITKRQSGDTLTAWELSCYRLNVRDNGERYSADPVIRERQYAEDTTKTGGRS